MNDINPYQTPEDSSLLKVETRKKNLVDAQRCPAGHGWQWLADAFSMFTSDVLKWIGISFIWVVVIFAINMVPMGSFLSSIVGPLFMGGFAFAAQRADLEKNFDVGDLFEGFRSQIGNLILIGTLYAIACFIIFLVCLAIMLPFVDFDTLLSLVFMEEKISESLIIDLFVKLAIPFLFASLVGLSLMLPVIMSLWFAPVLAMLHGVSALDAIKKSFRGCAINVLPFTVYALVVLPLAFIATIPLGIGWFVLGPVLALATYTAYKDIFLQKSDASAEMV